VSSENQERVSEYIRAIGEGRLDELSAYLHPDVVFEGAGVATTHGAEEYIAALRRLSPIIARNEIKRVFVDGDEACVFYDFVTDTAAGPIATVEWLTIVDGRIASIYLLFDKARWPEVLEHLELAVANA
jgi:limonene-1,2-epoxide hydrolase